MPTSVQLLKVNNLPLPQLLTDLIRRGKWQHPDDEVLRKAIPFMQDPVDFLSIDAMVRESKFSLADDPTYNGLFRELRGSTNNVVPDLPWIDANLCVLIAANRYPGDDVAIALDYRINHEDPRVVASEWIDQVSFHATNYDYENPVHSWGHFWREVTPTFSEFVERIGL